ncbi:hypothetical protein JCM4814A_90310 [Streptomyces phaeofaciens JCM 4814]
MPQPLAHREDRAEPHEGAGEAAEEGEPGPFVQGEAAEFAFRPAGGAQDGEVGGPLALGEDQDVHGAGAPSSSDRATLR